MEKNILDARVKYSRMVKESKNRAKQKKCLWCGKTITRFCNSHSVPRCIIDNIDINGKLDYFNIMVNIPILNQEKGLNEAGTFKLLCRECDSKIFQDYESVEALLNVPNEKMLEEIALKNNLMMLNKRFFEVELNKTVKDEYSKRFRYDYRQKIKSLDEKDFWFDYERIKQMMLNDDQNEEKYNLILGKKLDYVVPIAFQGLVTLYGDLEGNLVSNIYDDDENIIISHIHICVFPMKEQSVVFAFYHNKDSEFDGFSEQFNKLPDDKKLQMIAYLVFEYNEEFFLAPKFPHRTWMINKMKDTFRDTSIIIGTSEEHIKYQKESQLKRLSNIDKNFPCILDEKFSLKTSV